MPVVSWSLSPPIKTPAQSLRLALCARPEWVSRLDLATQEFHRANPRAKDARKQVEFCQWRLVGPVLPILPAIDPFNLAFIKRPPASYLRLPGSGHEATRLSPVPGVHRTTWPIVPRRTPGSHEMWPPPQDRDPPLFSGRLLFPQWNSLYHSTKIRVSLLRCQFLLPDAAVALTA